MENIEGRPKKKVMYRRSNRWQIAARKSMTCQKKMAITIVIKIQFIAVVGASKRETAIIMYPSRCTFSGIFRGQKYFARGHFIFVSNTRGVEFITRNATCGHSTPSPKLVSMKSMYGVVIPRVQSDNSPICFVLCMVCI